MNHKISTAVLLIIIVIISFTIIASGINTGIWNDERVAFAITQNDISKTVCIGTPCDLTVDLSISSSASIDNSLVCTQKNGLCGNGPANSSISDIIVGNGLIGGGSTGIVNINLSADVCPGGKASSFNGSSFICLNNSSSVTPAGSNGAVQYNNNGSLAGNDSKLFLNDTSGRVGIGTNKPKYKLDLQGNSGNNYEGVLFNLTNQFNSGSFLVAPRSGGVEHIAFGSGSFIARTSLLGSNLTDTGLRFATIAGGDASQASGSALFDYGSIYAEPKSLIGFFLRFSNTTDKARTQFNVNPKEICLASPTSNDLSCNGGGEVMYINLSTGFTGMGTIVPGLNLEVEDNTKSTAIFRLDNSAGQCDHTPGSGSETVTCSSDERLKPGIKEVNTSKVIEELKARAICIREYHVIKTFEEKVIQRLPKTESNDNIIFESDTEIHTNYAYDINESWKIGFSAQCLQEIAPQLVHNQFNFTGYLWNQTSEEAYYVENETLLSVEQPDVNELFVGVIELYKRNKVLEERLELFKQQGFLAQEAVELNSENIMMISSELCQKTNIDFSWC